MPAGGGGPEEDEMFADNDEQRSGSDSIRCLWVSLTLYPFSLLQQTNGTQPTTVRVVPKKTSSC